MLKMYYTKKTALPIDGEDQWLSSKLPPRRQSCVPYFKAYSDDPREKV